MDELELLIGRVLVVEDDEEIADVLRRSLRQEGHEVRTAVDGDVPINPSGGLISRGHPVGATGLAQVYELILQLRGEAANQVKDPRLGLAHNLGGSGALSTVHILQKDF